MNERHLQLARRLYELARLRQCFEEGGQPLPIEPEKEQAFVNEKMNAFQSDVHLFEQEFKRVQALQKRIEEKCMHFLNYSALTEVAVWEVLRRTNWKTMIHGDPVEEYHRQVETAKTWRHGAANPNLSDMAFDVDTSKETLVHYVIAEETQRLLGVVAESDMQKEQRLKTRKLLSQLKEERSQKGKVMGKVNLFALPEDAAQRRALTGILAGVGLEHAGPSAGAGPTL